MDKPISLGMFNVLPHLTPAFFEYSLRWENYRWNHPYMGASTQNFWDFGRPPSPCTHFGLIHSTKFVYILNEQRGLLTSPLTPHIADVLLMVPCVKNKTPSYVHVFLGRLDTRARSSSPLVAGGDIGPVDVNLWAWEVVRYKYKFFKAEEHDVSN